MHDTHRLTSCQEEISFTTSGGHHLLVYLLAEGTTEGFSRTFSPCKHSLQDFLRGAKASIGRFLLHKRHFCLKARILIKFPCALLLVYFFDNLAKLWRTPVKDRTSQEMADVAAEAAHEAAIQLAEIEKNDRIATLAARAAAARAARCAQEALSCYAYAQKFARSAADKTAVDMAEDAAISAKRSAQIAAEKAKWRSNPSHAGMDSLMSQEQRFEDEIDQIETAWDSGDVDTLVELGALSPYLARHLKVDMRK